MRSGGRTNKKQKRTGPNKSMKRNIRAVSRPNRQTRANKIVWNGDDTCGLVTTASSLTHYNNDSTNPVILKGTRQIAY